MIANAGETTALMMELGSCSPSRMTRRGWSWRALSQTAPVPTGRMGCWPNVRWRIVEL